MLRLPIQHVLTRQKKQPRDWLRKTVKNIKYGVSHFSINMNGSNVSEKRV